MNNITFYIKAFITLLVLVNPLEGMPIFLGATQNIDPLTKLKIAKLSPLAVVIILVVSLFLGNAVLYLFGISIAAFQIGGGIILFLIAVKMVLGADNTSFSNMSGGQIRTEFAIMPLATPIFAGPGAINGAVLYSTRVHSLLEMAILSGVFILIGIILYFTLRTATQLAKHIGATGISIATRIMGLIVTAIAVEMIAHGIASLFGIKVI